MEILLKCWFLLFFKISTHFYFSFSAVSAEAPWNGRNALSVNNGLGAQYSVNKTHTFHAGEGTNFTCLRDARSVDCVMLTYKTRQSSWSTGAQRAGAVNFYRILEPLDKGAVVTCTFYADRYYTPVDHITITLIFNRKQTDNMLFFKVNGLRLPHVGTWRNNSSVESYSEYKYCVGEDVAVAVYRDDRTFEQVRCNATGATVSNDLVEHFDAPFKWSNVVESTVMRENSDVTRVQCAARSGLAGTLHRVTLTLVLHAPEYIPFISGLSMSNVLVQYTDVEGNNIVWYSIGSETLYLTCVAPAEYGPDIKLTWIAGHVITPVERLTRLRPIKLHPDKNYTVMTCDVNSPTGHKTTFLHLKRRHERAAAGTTSQPTATGRTAPLYIAALVVVAVLLTAAGLVAAFRNTKRRNIRHKSLSQQGHMTLLPSPTDRPDDVTHTQSNLTHLYATPVVKSQRTKLEEVYAEPADSIRESTNQNSHQLGEPTYASVYNAEPTYASVDNKDSTHTSEQPLKHNQSITSKKTDANRGSIDNENHGGSKRERKHAKIKNKTCDVGENSKNSNLYDKAHKKHNRYHEGNNSNDLTYSEIYHKNVHSNSVATEMPIYSKILPQNIYANLSYELKSKNNADVNVDVKYHVEPAYCEVLNL